MDPITSSALPSATSWDGLILPPAASRIALLWDDLFYFLTTVSLLFFIPLILTIVYFVYKYHHKKRPEAAYIHGNTPLEILWTVVPTILVMVIFTWGWFIYKKMNRPPKDAIEIRVTGEQWRWVFNYENGKEDYNILRVPMGRRIKLIMTSDDVIHSLFIPDFRRKSDVVPGLYSSVWFETEKIGEHRIYCSEYCGGSHSQMLATLKVVSQDDWDKWYHVKKEGAQTPEGRGEEHTNRYGCTACHSNDGSPRQGPSFKAIWGKTETLADGSKVIIDERYIRNKILNPNGTPEVKGYQRGLMPPFQGLIKEGEILDIIAYIKTLK